MKAWLAVLVMLTLLGLIGVQSVCIGDCGGEILTCSQVDQLTTRFARGDRSTWRRRFRVRVDPWPPEQDWPTCAAQEWVVYLADEEAISFAVDATREPLLTIHLLGQYADADAFGMQLLGAEVPRYMWWYGQLRSWVPAGWR